MIKKRVSYKYNEQLDVLQILYTVYIIYLAFKKRDIILLN